MKDRTATMWSQPWLKASTLDIDEKTRVLLLLQAAGDDAPGREQVTSLE